jgi:lambda family phage portal protein
MNLATRAAMWPTPQTDSFRTRSGARKTEKGLDRMARDWPTPMASDGCKPSGGNRKSADLTHVAGMWPTPLARDWKGTNSPEHVKQQPPARNHMDRLANFAVYSRQALTISQAGERTPAIVKLFTLDLYDDAELERKKTAAMFAMFITSPAPETPLDPADEDLEVEPGQVVRLDPGEDVSTPATPDSGSTYEPFQYRTLLQISAALGIPYGYLTNDTAKGNFSNTRISLVDFRRRISAWQHGVLVYQMCRAVWSRWMDMAVLSGALEFPDYDIKRGYSQACMWLPTKWDWVDPMKDASAEILQIEAGLKSRTQALSERGYDAEQVEREIAAERKRELALGLDFRRPGSPAQAAGQGGAQSEASDEEADDADQETSERQPVSEKEE